MGAVPLASPTESCSAPGTNLMKFESAYALLTASPAAVGFPTFVIAALLADSPAAKAFAPAQRLTPLSRATLLARRVSLIVPVVAGLLIALMMPVPESAPPPVALVSVDPSEKMIPLPAPVSL